MQKMPFTHEINQEIFMTHNINRNRYYQNPMATLVPCTVLLYGIKQFS